VPPMPAVPRATAWTPPTPRRRAPRRRYRRVFRGRETRREASFGRTPVPEVKRLLIGRETANLWRVCRLIPSPYARHFAHNPPTRTQDQVKCQSPPVAAADPFRSKIEEKER